ncbi:hypothetical protein BHE74_00013630 [Ensete ventricosum]|nr:hypothetical protein GW17_00005546 [Ensete ventricosum]RWW78172.1 hypothetical protein BHE74_00013630 [Ensete ventricosum]
MISRLFSWLSTATPLQRSLRLPTFEFGASSSSLQIPTIPPSTFLDSTHHSLNTKNTASLCSKSSAMGATVAATASHYSHTHKAFLFCNYTLLGAATSCVFLTLSLRLIPSPCGLLLVALHALTAVAAASACATTPASTARWHAAHMASTVLAAIFHGAIAVLAFTRTPDFLAELRSYVREEDGAVILKMVGGLGVAIFCLEWVALAVAFVLRYHAYVEGGSTATAAKRSSKVVGSDEELKDWPWPFQV